MDTAGNDAAALAVADLIARAEIDAAVDRATVDDHAACVGQAKDVADERAQIGERNPAGSREVGFGADGDSRVRFAGVSKSSVV